MKNRVDQVAKLLCLYFVAVGGYGSDDTIGEALNNNQDLKSLTREALCEFWDLNTEGSGYLRDINGVILIFLFSGFNDQLEDDGHCGPQLEVAINNYLKQIGEEPLPKKVREIEEAVSI